MCVIELPKWGYLHSFEFIILFYVTYINSVITKRDNLANLYYSFQNSNLLYYFYYYCNLAVFYDFLIVFYVSLCSRACVCLALSVTGWLLLFSPNFPHSVSCTTSLVL